MPPKTVIQLPVTMQLSGITMSIVGTAIDVHASYLPVDDKGEPVGQIRSYTEHIEGPQVKTVTDWVTAIIVPKINEVEGT